jgi:hypothetical protein
VQGLGERVEFLPQGFEFFRHARVCGLQGLVGGNDLSGDEPGIPVLEQSFGAAGPV